MHSSICLHVPGSKARPASGQTWCRLRKGRDCGRAPDVGMTRAAHFSVPAALLMVSPTETSPLSVACPNKDSVPQESPTSTWWSWWINGSHRPNKSQLAVSSHWWTGGFRRVGWQLGCYCRQRRLLIVCKREGERQQTMRHDKGEQKKASNFNTCSKAKERATLEERSLQRARTHLMRQRPPTCRSLPPLNLHGARGNEEQILACMFFCFIIRSDAAWALSRGPDESVDTSLKGLTQWPSLRGTVWQSHHQIHSLF